MNKKITLMLITAALCASAWSCGSKVGSGDSSGTTAAVSSETASAADTSAQTTAADTAADTAAESVPATVGADGRYKTPDGLFSFKVGDNLKLVENGSGEYDYAFSAGDDGSMLGIKAVTNMHQTAIGFSESIVPTYEEKFDNVVCKEVEVNGLPAAKLAANYTDNGQNFVFVYTMVQYGNGDLFTLMATLNANGSYNYDEDFDAILASVEYTGAPLKTGGETCETDSFSFTVGDKFYVYSKDSGEASVKYNLANDSSEYLCKMSIKAEEAASVEELAESIGKKRRENTNTKSFEEGTEEFLGRESHSSLWKLEAKSIPLTCEQHIFEVNGKVYSVTIIAQTNGFARFTDDCEKILETLSFK